MAFAVVGLLFVPTKGSTVKPFDVTSLPQSIGKQVSWQDSSYIADVLAEPEVRLAIQRQAATSPKARKVQKMQQKGYFTEWLTAASAVPRSMGVKTQKVNKALVEQPIGKVIAAALASFAKRGQPIVDVQQREDGCTFTVYTFADMWSNSTILTVNIQRSGPHITAVEAEATTKGATDGGKSNRAISKLFTQLQDASCFAEPVLAT